jgi:three-Cys-motif partner protein
MKAQKNFKWIIGSVPPPLQAHSAAKLNLLEHYLDSYFKTVVPGPYLDRLQISMIDGFCGGGAFRGVHGKIEAGTPIIMLNAVGAAMQRLNKDRRKKLAIDGRFYFVDKDPAAIDYLRSEIWRLGYGPQIGETIHLIKGKFEDNYKNIVEDIRAKARAGRSIFLLDQFGYGKIPLTIAREIFEQLPKAEIILTFAIDWLISYMSDNAAFLKGVAPIEITQDQVKRFIAEKGVKGHRFLIQRLLLQHLRLATGAPYFTPFFIRSEEADRDLWLIHLSKHPTARNVMTSSHWAIQNSSIHQGPAGLNMLGFDPHWQDALPLNFEFDGNAEAQIVAALHEQIPRKLEALDGFGPITFDAFQRETANNTAARLDQLERSLMTLHEQKDIQILTPSGKLKQPGARIKAGDRLQLSRQLMLLF